MADSDPTSWPALAAMDPEYAKYLETAPPAPPPLTDPSQMPQARAMMKKTQIHAPIQQIDRTGVTQEDIQITARDGHEIPAVLYKPSTPAAAPGPLAVLMHGGGFCVGFPEQEAPPAIALVQNHHAVVISVDYRLAPEHVFPQAIEDSWDALKWAASHASSLHCDPRKGFLVGGSSAGGNIAAVLSHLARGDHLSPPLTGVWLNYPLTVGRDAVPAEWKEVYHSHVQNGNAPGMFNTAAMQRTLDNYKPDQQSELFSPLLWSTGHEGLPRTQLHACGLDMLRDDTLLYARELKKAGVEVRLEVYPGVPHAFDAMYPQFQLAAKFREDRKKAFAWLLDG